MRQARQHDARRARSGASGLALAAILLAIGAGPWRHGVAAAEADSGDAAQVALGARVYAANCAQCHGAHLEGQPNWRTRKPDSRLPAPPQDYHGHTWRHPDQELFNTVRNGVAAYAPPGYQTDMAGFAGVLSDAQIWAVLAYIKSTWPPEFREYQAAVTRRADGR